MSHVVWKATSNKRNSWIATLVFAASLLLTACNPQPTEIADTECRWRVAWDPYEPYSYTDDDDVAIGFDIDVVTEVAARVGCELSFEEMAWNDILEALESGAVDVTVGTGYKSDRAAWSWYSESYRKEVIGLLVRKGTAAAFPGSTIDDVLASGLVFGKTSDDTYGPAMEHVFAQYPKQIRPRVSEAENVERLLNQSIDGFLIEVNVASALVARLGVAPAVEFHSLAFDAGTYRLQISKKTISPERLADINAAIQALSHSGWLARGIEAYGIQGLNED